MSELKRDKSKPEFAKELFYEAFGDTEEFLSLFERTAFSPDRCHYIYDGDEVVSALYWFDCEYLGERLAYIYGVATAKKKRGQGLCHRLFKEAHALLKEKGYAGAILVPAKTELYGLYESMGYKTVTTLNERICKKSDATIDFNRINKDEYKAKRRLFLPEGSVIEEGAALDFLDGYSEFYLGEDFLIVLSRDEGGVYSPELLGNPDAFPAVLRTLGYDGGRVRTPGEGRPFAMYYPFVEALVPPKYFGLALD